jgi:hypothetical protein
MGNRKISSDLKECALRLWNTGWDGIEDIHNALGASRASIFRWESIFAELTLSTVPRRQYVAKSFASSSMLS